MCDHIVFLLITEFVADVFCCRAILALGRSESPKLLKIYPASQFTTSNMVLLWVQILVIDYEANVKI